MHYAIAKHCVLLCKVIMANTKPCVLQCEMALQMTKPCVFTAKSSYSCNKVIKQVK